METIFALSSGAPPAAIAVVRISGPSTLEAVTRLAGKVPPPRTAALRSLRAPDGSILDRALVLVFPGERSATGEDLAELHLHGGRAVVRAVEAALAEMPGLRPALAGEFTRRALANGRIDLLEAEGLGDLLLAETEQQRRAALSVATGGLSRMIDGWTSRVLGLAARVEAELDFSDEDDVPAFALEAIARDAVSVADEMRAALADPPVDRLRDGLRVVIAGPPNSGKSTLLNAMAERDAAIVSPIAGTTRDVIETPVMRDGVAYVLTDTAGLTTATDDPIEQIGVARAAESIAGADLILWLGDDAPPMGTSLWLHARADEPGRKVTPVGPDLALSAQTKDGMAELWREMARRCAAMLPRPDALAMTERQRAIVNDAASCLAACSRQSDPVLVAENLRSALAAFDRLTGRAGAEAMLDTLFARFCIGK